MKTYYYLVRRTIVTAAFGLIIVATLIVPALACAQGNSPLADLQAQVTALQATVTSLQNQVNSLKTQFSAVQSNNALALGPFVSVDPNPENGVAGPNIKFIGANIHILSGSGATDDNLVAAGSLTGLGNLIIGYDETAPFGVVNRGGSHNLVIGRWHNFTSSAWGGLVAGESNTISAYAVSVLGGSQNTITLNAPYSSIVGGGAEYSNICFLQHSWRCFQRRRRLRKYHLWWEQQQDYRR